MGRFGSVVFTGLLAMLIAMLYYKFRVEKLPADNVFSEKCRYDTTVLCETCFPKSVNCSIFENYSAFGNLSQEVIDQFNEEGVPIALRDNGNRKVMVHNLNRDKAIETLWDSVCQAVSRSSMDDCFSRKNRKEFLETIRQWVLDEDRSKGALFCPPDDVLVLRRFVEKFDQPELQTLMLIDTNSQSLMVQLGSQHNLPVPSFIFQAGFLLVVRSDGEPLTNFYQAPLALRLKIANKLISAIFNLNSGVDNFRFYLTDMSPDNIVVNVLPSGEVNVTFVALDTVIVHDVFRKKPSQVACGCFGFKREDDCIYNFGDMNLFSVCELLLENQKGERDGGFLYNSMDVFEFRQIRKQLNHCVYCDTAFCKDRKIVLQQIQHLISTT